MKKIALILQLFLGMALSFAAIGLVILFATGAVRNLDEAKQLLSGQMPGGESAFLQEDEVTEVEDALLLLQRQKQEMEKQSLRHEEERTVLEEQKTSLSEVMKNMNKQT